MHESARDVNELRAKAAALATRNASADFLAALAFRRIAVTITVPSKKIRERAD